MSVTKLFICQKLTRIKNVFLNTFFYTSLGHRRLMKASEFPSFLERVKALAFSKLELILRVDIDIDVYGIIVLS